MFLEYQDIVHISQPISSGILTGKVVDVNDPKKLGRIRVHIPEIFSETIQVVSKTSSTSQPAKEGLPWVYPSISFLGGLSETALICIPQLDSLVQVKINRDIHEMYYIASPVTTSTKSGKLDKNYPKTYGFVDPIGNHFLVDMVAKTIEVHQVDGQTLLMKPEGVDLTVTGNYYAKVSGNSTTEVEGDVLVKAGGSYKEDISGSANTSVGSSYTVTTGGTLNLN